MVYYGHFTVTHFCIHSIIFICATDIQIFRHRFLILRMYIQPQKLYRSRFGTLTVCYWNSMVLSDCTSLNQALHCNDMVHSTQTASFILIMLCKTSTRRTTSKQLVGLMVFIKWFSNAIYISLRAICAGRFISPWRCWKSFCLHVQLLPFRLWKLRYVYQVSMKWTSNFEPIWCWRCSIFSACMFCCSLFWVFRCKLCGSRRSQLNS